MRTISIVCSLLISLSFDCQSVEGRLSSVLDLIFSTYPESVGIMAHVESTDLSISWSGASGYSDRYTKAELNPEAPALIASSIKTLMSAAILKLIEKGAFDLNTPIKALISEHSRDAFLSDGYDLDRIQVRHLLSHTSGIYNYADLSYIQFADSFPRHRWTRDEQLKRSLVEGDPLGEPGTLFQYADANYLLLGEMIEKQTGTPFYEGLAELLDYEKLGLDGIWFPTLEEEPMGSLPLVHQYWSKMNWDSYDIDISWDLYGGGGIACTTSDLARFVHSYFNGEIIEDEAIRDLIFTHIKTEGTKGNPYYLGLSRDIHNGLVGYGHGGFWGTVMMHYPAINTSISVFILDRDSGALRGSVLEELTRVILETISSSLKKVGQ